MANRQEEVKHEEIYDGMMFLSEHIRRYHSVSIDKLREMADGLVRSYKVDEVITQTGANFLADFVHTVVEQLQEKKLQLARERAEMATVKRSYDRLLAQQALASPPPLPDRPPPINRHEQSLSIASPSFSTGEVVKVDLNKLVKKPRYFDGVTPLPREWIEEYEDAIEDNLWNDATAIYYFKHFLVGHASDWFKLAVRPLITSS